MARQSLGEFEQLVLLACLRLGEGAYPVAIGREIERRTSRRPSHAAVYVALRRLEGRGLVSSELGSPTPQRGGRAKRFFKLESDAVSLLEDSRRALLNMWEGLNPSAGR